MPVFRYRALRRFSLIRTDIAPSRPAAPVVPVRWMLGTTVVVLMALLTAHVAARGQSSSTVLAPQVAAATETPPPGSAVRVAPSRPAWSELTAAQQQALHPLVSVWDGLSETHKRKWLALSRNHAKLSPEEQAIQHSRMSEWATLNPRERAQARFNFAEVKQFPADERKAKWEAYQALSAEEKRKLAEGAPARPHGVAPTISSVPARKIAPVPIPAHKSGTFVPPTASDTARMPAADRSP